MQLHWKIDWSQRNILFDLEIYEDSHSGSHRSFFGCCIFVLFCFTFIFFFFLNFFLFFFNLKEQVLLELLGLLKGRLVTRHSVFKSVLQQDYLEGDRIY